MAITPDDIRRISDLARLQLDESQIPGYTTNLAKVVDLFEEMNQIDTSGVTPLSHPFDTTQPLRADMVTEPDENDALMALAPEHESGLYLVPKVIE